MDRSDITNLQAMMTAPVASNAGSDKGSTSWFKALAQAWGQTLDAQAARIENMSDQIGNEGNDTPSQIVTLTAESLRMGFLSNSQSSSTNSVGSALETMARKQ